MEITIQKQTINTRDKSDNQVVSKGYQLRNGATVIGFYKIPNGLTKGSQEETEAYRQAYAMADEKRSDFIVKSGALAGMKFSIGKHRKKFIDESDPKNPIVTWKKGFILRGSDSKFALFGETEAELQKIADKAKGGGHPDPVQVSPQTKPKEQRTPEEIAAQKQKKAENDKKYREKIKNQDRK